MRHLSFKFDDGFLDGAQAAAEILAPDHGSFFLIGELLDGGPLKDREPLFQGRRFGPAQAWRDLAAAGHDLQPHSYSHPRFDTISPGARRLEAERSVAGVRRLAGRASVFGYPYNRFAETDLSGLGLIAAGFETAASDAPPRYHDLTDRIDLWRLKSWAVRERDLDAVVAALTDLPDESWIVLTFHSLDGEGHEPWTREGFRLLVDEVRRLGFSISTVAEMASRIERGGDLERARARAESLTAVGESALYIAPVESAGMRFRFLCNSREDHIQGHFARGDVYEREELDLICELAPTAKRFLDVGANVGNHSIFLAHALDLERTTPIEPQPAVLDLLRSNLGLNWHPSFDLAHLGVGLGARRGSARIASFNPANLGGTRLQMNPVASEAPVAGAEEEIAIETGDALFDSGDFDLIKIDAEGMELDVMEGMGRVLHDFNGLLFMEILDAHASECAAYLDARGWRRIREFRRYQKCTNWYLVRSDG